MLKEKTNEQVHSYVLNRTKNRFIDCRACASRRRCELIDLSIGN